MEASFAFTLTPDHMSGLLSWAIHAPSFASGWFTGFLAGLAVWACLAVYHRRIGR